MYLRKPSKVVWLGQILSANLQENLLEAGKGANTPENASTGVCAPSFCEYTLWPYFTKPFVNH